MFETHREASLERLERILLCSAHVCRWWRMRRQSRQCAAACRLFCGFAWLGAREAPQVVQVCRLQSKPPWHPPIAYVDNASALAKS